MREKGIEFHVALSPAVAQKLGVIRPKPAVDAKNSKAGSSNSKTKKAADQDTAPPAPPAGKRGRGRPPLKRNVKKNNEIAAKKARRS